MNLAACGSLTRSPETGFWYRAIQPQYWKTSLQTIQTTKTFSRFNAGVNSSPPFELLYLAQDHLVALFEVQALLGYAYGTYLPSPARHWAIIYVQVSLRYIADLTDSTTQLNLQTTAQELTGDWFGYEQRKHSFSLRQPTGLAPTQQLGAELFKVGSLEGFKTISAKVPDKTVLVVFPEKLAPGSFVRFVDPATGESVVIDAETR